eukprot:TRINITY_DN9050_c0_g1_i1.p1 TRINITY_DN9050_c0_g1~~TRINITY_DN9050_c0_g1_i1.p1  ORF type:complete len:171 (+),score=20.65 TRINITY_DN9050_c0_g1_i1:68-514(+)
MQITTLRLSPSKVIQRNDWTVAELVTRKIKAQVNIIRIQAVLSCSVSVNFSLLCDEEFAINAPQIWLKDALKDIKSTSFLQAELISELFNFYQKLGFLDRLIEVKEAQEQAMIDGDLPPLINSPTSRKLVHHKRRSPPKQSLSPMNSH